MMAVHAIGAAVTVRVVTMAQNYWKAAVQSMSARGFPRLARLHSSDY